MFKYNFILRVRFWKFICWEVKIVLSSQLNLFKLKEYSTEFEKDYTLRELILKSLTCTTKSMEFSKSFRIKTFSRKDIKTAFRHTPEKYTKIWNKSLILKNISLKIKKNFYCNFSLNWCKIFSRFINSENKLVKLFVSIRFLRLESFIFKQIKRRCYPTKFRKLI